MVNISKVNIEKIEHCPDLNQLWEHAVNERFAIAVWRLPKQHNLHFMADFSGNPLPQKIDFESAKSGFCLSNFLNQNGEKTQLLNNDIYFEIDCNNFKIKPDTNTIGQNIFIEKVEKYFEDKPKIAIPESPKIEFVKSEKETFKKLVTKAIGQIKIGSFQKVVLSRQKVIEFDHIIDIGDCVKKLAKKYPNAFISAVYLPENNEIWMGASPELLVSLDENGIFKTMSLAGTQAAVSQSGEVIDPANARWSQKEIEEQAFVSRYIIDCFKKVRVREYIENGPKTIAAGNLLHLQTTYLVDTKAIKFNQFATVLLELLHPTSAVCGMPREAAEAFILENEAYNRELYSGYLGPIKVANASNIFVNLRSLKIQGNKTFLYAGAGITEDSDPEKEWQETEIKMETLLNVINE
jgi:isochorismate synthase